MSKSITIYTTNTCASCAMVKKLLATKGFDYTEINVDEQPDLRQQAISISGQMSVPVTVISNSNKDNDARDITVGWNPAKLMAALSE